MAQARITGRHLPQSLTGELEAHKEDLHKKTLVDSMPSYLNTRARLMERLGGEFDYIGFEDSLRDVMADKDKILREFD